MNVEIKHIDLKTLTKIYFQILLLPVIILCFAPCMLIYSTLLKGLISPIAMILAFLIYCIFLFFALYIFLIAIIIAYNKLAIKNGGIRIRVVKEEQV